MERGELKETLLRCSDVETMEDVVRSWKGRRATARLSRNLVFPIEVLITRGKLAEAAAVSLSLAYEHQDAFVSMARQLGVFRAWRVPGCHCLPLPSRFNRDIDLMCAALVPYRLSEPIATPSFGNEGCPCILNAYLSEGRSS
jgi:hypothetical protein